MSSLPYDYSSFIVPLTLPRYKSPLRELCRIHLTHPDIAYLSVCVLPQKRLHILAAYAIQRYRLSLNFYNLITFYINHFYVFFLNTVINKRNEIKTEDALYQMFCYLLDNKIHHAFVAFGYNPYSHPT